MQQDSPAESISVIRSSRPLNPIYKTSIPIPAKKHADLVQLCNKNGIP